MADLPWAPDVALVTVGREACVDAVEALAARGCRHAVLYAAGFAELGVDGARLQDRMVAAARASGMRLLGPNCMSLFVARSRLNLTGIPDLRPGRLAFVSQSGNLVYDLVEHGRRSGLGLSLFLSLGNQADLGFEDVLDAVLHDPDTAAVALYVEAVRPGRGRAFLEAVHRLARAKPVVALIGGRTDSGRRASASHTAALLSDVRQLRGLLRQAGAIEVTRLDELFPVADALVKCRPRPCPRSRSAAEVAAMRRSGATRWRPTGSRSRRRPRRRSRRSGRSSRPWRRSGTRSTGPAPPTGASGPTGTRRGSSSPTPGSAA